MFHLAKLHTLAATRGDGLRPELLNLLHERAGRLQSGVTEIHGDRQAGPAPTLRDDGPLPENVVRISPVMPQRPAGTATITRQHK